MKEIKTIISPPQVAGNDQNADIDKIDKRLTALETWRQQSTDQSGMEEQINDMDNRLELIEYDVGEHQDRLNSVEKEAVAAEHSIDQLKNQLVELQQHFNRLNDQFKDQQALTEELFSLLEDHVAGEGKCDIRRAETEQQGASN